MKSGSNSLGYMSKITNATEEASQINSLFEPPDNDKNKDKYKINNTQISDGDFIKIITDDNKVDYLLFDKNEQNVVKMYWEYTLEKREYPVGLNKTTYDVINSKGEFYKKDGYLVINMRSMSTGYYNMTPLTEKATNVGLILKEHHMLRFLWSNRYI